MVTATLSGQAKPSFLLGGKKKTTKSTKEIQVASEDPDQKLFTGHAKRVRSDYVQDSNAADGIVPGKGLPLVLHS